MNEQAFVKFCKELVRDYTNQHLDPADGVTISTNEVFIVWMCKTLQNNKALLSTTHYEVTYNGDKQEAYLDAYKKFENRRVPVKEGT